MQRYPVRRDHLSHLNLPEIETVARRAFGTAESEGDFVRASFGALEELRARPAGKELEVETRMNPKVSVETAAETVRRYNQFLQESTGYTSKERAKRLRKSSGSGSDET